MFGIMLGLRFGLELGLGIRDSVRFRDGVSDYG